MANTSPAKIRLATVQSMEMGKVRRFPQSNIYISNNPVDVTEIDSILGMGLGIGSGVWGVWPGVWVVVGFDFDAGRDGAPQGARVN
jgi:hypothetical protein